MSQCRADLQPGRSTGSVWPVSGINDGQLSERSIECPVYGKLVAQTNRRCRPEAEVQASRIITRELTVTKLITAGRAAAVVGVDRGDELQLAAAVRAMLVVDLEDTLE